VRISKKYKKRSMKSMTKPKKYSPVLCDVDVDVDMDVGKDVDEAVDEVAVFLSLSLFVKGTGIVVSVVVEMEEEMVEEEEEEFVILASGIGAVVSK